jgi:hypothetical protein
MGKRSSFVRRKADAYDTPCSAVAPLLRHLRPATRFIEPCAGKGDLVRWLEDAGHHCMLASDIEPRHGCWEGDIQQHDILNGDLFFGFDDSTADCFVTNPPWSRDVLHRIILRLAAIMPTWLLFDSDWVSTTQAVPYLPLLHRIVAVGRVRWIEGSPYTSKDNAAWHLFHHPRPPGRDIVFFGRG